MKKITKLSVACIQVNAGNSWQDTWKRVCDRYFPEALSEKAKIIVLPEMFLMRSSIKDLRLFAEESFDLIVKETQLFCRKNKVAVLLGSLPEVDPENSKKIYNTSVLISEKGSVVAKYRKIHLFDINLEKTCSIKESKDISSGEKVVIAKIHGIIVGLSICYDLRFPELFRILSQKKCRIAFVPANFVMTTGKVHWEVLLRARAIENQIFILAPNQSGVNRSNGIESYGRSMIISPWGEVLKKAKVRGEEVLVAELDFAEQDSIQRYFPVLKHRRIT